MRLECASALAVVVALLATTSPSSPSTATGSAQDGSNATGAIHGTAFYRERMSIPPNAVFEVTLEEVSRQDAPVLIARVRNEQPGSVPIPFVIAYDAARIDRSLPYAVRGQILVKGEVWFYTQRYQPVLATADDMPVTILMQRMRGAPSTRSAEPSSGALENTYWKLTRLGNDSVTVGTQAPEPHFVLHPGTHRVTGFGGCNRFSGSYRVDGDGLALGDMASTKMACAEGMETEQRFFTALGAPSKWRITRDQLELMDASGAMLARFVSVILR